MRHLAFLDDPVLALVWPKDRALSEPALALRQALFDGAALAESLPRSPSTSPAVDVSLFDANRYPSDATCHTLLIKHSGSVLAPILLAAERGDRWNLLDKSMVARTLPPSAG